MGIARAMKVAAPLVLALGISVAIFGGVLKTFLHTNLLDGLIPTGKSAFSDRGKAALRSTQTLLAAALLLILGVVLCAIA